MKAILVILVAAAALMPCRAFKIGVLNNPGAGSIIKTLSEDGKYQVIPLNSLTPEALDGLNVLVIQSRYDEKNRELIREKVRKGMGLLMTHDAAGSGRNLSKGGGGTFPEIIRKPLPNSIINSRARKFHAVQEHPVTKGLSKFFTQSFSDYAVLAPVDDGMVLLADNYAWQAPAIRDRKELFSNQSRWRAYRGSNAVLTASAFGTGRVILYGGLFGLDINEKDISLTGDEKRLLLNAIAWLADETPYAIKLTGKTDRFPQMSGGGDEINFAGKSETTGAALPVPADMQELSLRLSVSEPVKKNFYYQVSGPVELPDGLVGVSVYDRGHHLVCTVPGEIKDKTLSFTALLPGNEFPAKIHAANKANLLRVRQISGSSPVEITGNGFRILAAVENQQPSIQALQMFDRQEHHTWDGLERESWSAPLLRLSDVFWPFRALPPRLYHERGQALPVFTEPSKYFGNRVEVTVGNGKLVVFPHGLVLLQGFAKEGRLATWGFDEYQAANRISMEIAAPDMPELSGNPLWAVKKNRYAIGGDLEIFPAIGVTGFSPGIVRKIRLKGNSLMLNTAAEGNLLQEKNEPLEISATVRPYDFSALAEPSPPELPLRSVNLYSLLEKRGSDRFLPSRPGVIEIFNSEIPEGSAITGWVLKTDQPYTIGSDWTKGALTLRDNESAKSMAALDPAMEEKGIYRRFYLRARTPGRIGIHRAELAGLAADGKILIRVPVEIREFVTIPRGIFLYTSQWTSWEKETTPEQYHKIFRDLRQMNFDYAIAQVDDTENRTENSTRIAERLARHGIFWMAGFNGVVTSWLKAEEKAGNLQLKKLKNSYSLPDTASFDRQVAAFVEQFRGTGNLLAYYLSDEIAQGKAQDGKLPTGYLLANHLYGLVKSLDAKHPAMNLISPHFTDYKTAAQYLKTDFVSWDKYLIGAKGIANDLDQVRKCFGNERIFWLTLRASGPFWYDTAHLYMDIRTQGAAAFLHGADSINYYKYLSIRESITWRDYGIVTLAENGVVPAPRRQAIARIMAELELASSIEYLIGKCPPGKANIYRERLNRAMNFGMKAEFHAMNEELNRLYGELVRPEISGRNAIPLRHSK